MKVLEKGGGRKKNTEKKIKSNRIEKELL